jgi:hypothetical protein
MEIEKALRDFKTSMLKMTLEVDLYDMDLN